jgi:hypothetical protein
MKIELPELPDRPYYTHDGDWMPLNDLYDENQMRAFAIAAVMEERERCAKLCEGLPVGHLPASPHRQGATICAQAIRNQPEPA